MKRSPLKRKTPMKRAGFVHLTEVAYWTKKRKPLAPMSAKTKAKIPARKKCCQTVRERSGGKCEVRHETCTGHMDHTHEIKPRSAGGDPTDPENCLAACFACHFFIHHVNPNEARRRGWLK